MKRTEIAKDYFSKKCHCSQAVLASFADEIGITEKMALKDHEKQQIADNYAKQFLNEFSKQNGSYLCRELLKCDLSSDEERQYAREHGLFSTICPRLIESAVLIAEQLMNEG